MSEFIVLSVHHDQQQVFIDFVGSTSREVALAAALSRRWDYRCHGGVYTAAECREFADRSWTSPADNSVFEEVH